MSIDIDRLDEEIGEELRAAQEALDRADALRAVALGRRRAGATAAMKARWTQERIGAEIGKDQRTVSDILKEREGL